MKMTDERINQLITQADGLAPQSGSIFRSLARLVEDESYRNGQVSMREMAACECKEIPASGYSTDINGNIVDQMIFTWKAVDAIRALPIEGVE